MALGKLVFLALVGYACALPMQNLQGGGVMPKPPFMFVPHYQDCLGHKNMGSWVSFCMPSTIANGCPMDSFNQLKDGPMAFDGPKCDSVSDGLPNPPYMDVPHYKDCLGHKDMGNWVSLCMPSTIANGCPLDSFNQLKDGPMAFYGPKCDSVSDGLPNPPYMDVPHYKDCLGHKDMGNWVSLCMPSTIANGCPLDSFNMLKDGPKAFDGPACDDTVKDLPPTPDYINIPHYKDCLAIEDHGLWSEFCMPSTRSNGCPQDSWNQLIHLDDPKKCSSDDTVKAMPPTPAYMKVPHYKDCLGHKNMGKWVSFCMPSTVANGCPQDSYNQLKAGPLAFDGPACDDTVKGLEPGTMALKGLEPGTMAANLLEPGTMDAMPPTPAYMKVPHYKDCLGHKDMGKWVSFCMPSTVANGCPQDSYNQLKAGPLAFDGPACDETVKGLEPGTMAVVKGLEPGTMAVVKGLEPGTMAANILEPGTMDAMPPTPAYMKVPHYKDCLGHKDMGNWVSFCMPSTVANGCPQDSYNQLKAGPLAFDGPACDDTVKGLEPGTMAVVKGLEPGTMAVVKGLEPGTMAVNILEPGTMDAMPPTPAYMKVPHYKDCLGQKDMGNWVSFCMPSTVANGCPQDSYNQLKAGPLTFDGPTCDDTVKGLEPGTMALKGLEPGTMAVVKGLEPGTMALKGLEPGTMAVNILEPGTMDAMPPTPAYMKVPHYKDCLGHKDMGKWVSFCMPATVANGCPQDSYNQLKAGPLAFDGPACDDTVKGLEPGTMSANILESGTMDAMPPTPAYMKVPHYKDCLGHKDMGKWVSFCMPATVANGCPVDSYNMLKAGPLAFDGPACDDTVKGMPPTPDYLNVPHYKECLGHKDFGAWWEYCMPSTIANGCPLDSFNKLKDVFDGSDCDDDVQDLPPTPDYINIPHYKDCLAIEDHGLWSEFCMPASRSNGCPQDSWNQLNELDDPKKCSSA